TSPSGVETGGAAAVTAAAIATGRIRMRVTRNLRRIVSGRRAPATRHRRGHRPPSLSTVIPMRLRSQWLPAEGRPCLSPPQQEPMRPGGIDVHSDDVALGVDA